MQLKDYGIEMVCPHCLCHYLLGMTGDVNGCDICEGNERNPVDNSIICKTPPSEMEKV
jgi:hypothetical protein